METTDKGMLGDWQEMSKLRLVVTEGQRLANAMRTMIEEHYGIRAEKLAELGLQPFRGRNGRPGRPSPPPATPAGTKV